MKEYRVRFTQYYSYLVEAENEDEAFEMRKVFLKVICAPLSQILFGTM